MTELNIEKERREFLELYAKIKSENIGELHAMGGWEWWLAAKRSMGSAEPVADIMECNGIIYAELRDPITVKPGDCLYTAPPAPVSADPRPEEEAEEDAAVIHKLATILAGVCVALKGEELPLHRHSYHDIVEVAQAIKLELDLYRMQAASAPPTTDAKDSERLDLMADEGCAIEGLQQNSITKYRLYWPWFNEHQGDWYESPRAAIDAYKAAIAEKEAGN